MKTKNKLLIILSLLLLFTLIPFSLAEEVKDVHTFKSDLLGVVRFEHKEKGFFEGIFTIYLDPTLPEPGQNIDAEMFISTQCPSGDIGRVRVWVKQGSSLIEDFILVDYGDSNNYGACQTNYITLSFNAPLNEGEYTVQVFLYRPDGELVANEGLDFTVTSQSQECPDPSQTGYNQIGNTVDGHGIIYENQITTYSNPPTCTPSTILEYEVVCDVNYHITGEPENVNIGDNAGDTCTLNSGSVGCVETNNGIEICDGLDNDCDLNVDEGLSCGDTGGSTGSRQVEITNVKLTTNQITLSKQSVPSPINLNEEFTIFEINPDQVGVSPTFTNTGDAPISFGWEVAIYPRTKFDTDVRDLQSTVTLNKEITWENNCGKQLPECINDVNCEGGFVRGGRYNDLQPGESVEIPTNIGDGVSTSDYYFPLDVPGINSVYTDGEGGKESAWSSLGDYYVVVQTYNTCYHYDVNTFEPYDLAWEKLDVTINDGTTPGETVIDPDTNEEAEIGFRKSASKSDLKDMTTEELIEHSCTVSSQCADPDVDKCIPITSLKADNYLTQTQVDTFFEKSNEIIEGVSLQSFTIDVCKLLVLGDAQEEFVCGSNILGIGLTDYYKNIQDKDEAEIGFCIDASAGFSFDSVLNSIQQTFGIDKNMATIAVVVIVLFLFWMLTRP